MVDCEQIGENLSGYLDGELTQGERQRVELHLESCPECQATYQEMVRLRGAVGQLSFGNLSHEEWSRMMNDLTVRSSRAAGWLLYVLGLVIVIAYGAYQFAVDDAVPALIKMGVAAIVLGLVCLFVSVLRQRLMEARSDKYKDVQI